MAGLSTHILDTSRGKPAADILVELFSVEQPQPGESHPAKSAAAPLVSYRTNSDGRTDQPLFADGQSLRGQYELRFHTGEYLRTHGLTGDGIHFLDVISIRFGINNPEEHYHVPLLLSPFGYSTYRGS